MSRSVLVVEDYEDLCSAIVHTLERRDIACESASSSEDAIGKLRANHYEAILLAPRLPLKDDPVMRFLMIAQPGEVRKVILMTAPEDADDRGPTDCRVLLKPFNNEQLYEQLKS
jgi:DNA-binding NtrC family response regulator